MSLKDNLIKVKSWFLEAFGATTSFVFGIAWALLTFALAYYTFTWIWASSNRLLDQILFFVPDNMLALATLLLALVATPLILVVLMVVAILVLAFLAWVVVSIWVGTISLVKRIFGRR